MNFVFVCPENNKTYESSNFTIIENKGVITDEDGNRQLDAKVALSEPCPFCGKRHTYHVNELTCPFS